ncbi:SRPBCC family protein [Glycomyces harbinensis]|uniref:Polyketide cyclase / dehydrase and lipid transport n=1 Tax=Glycomyces harbinensis TaxID=58114 RepID=A0A1G7CKS3_9ACTN|nr:SRPBCC domain-containing protein [Glycomyces harbinensis]SDE39958.1 Polyketide cyclase / dehydrase and lipid transport [Glycomyces harbinensis]
MKDAADLGVTVTVPAPPEVVFAVLADGWGYASWVVGASRIRDADADWPAKGTRICHSIGPWPLLIQDTTTVVAVRPPSLLVLDARMWPLGKARVRFDLAPAEGGTAITMREVATGGPLALLPVSVQTRLVAPRNRESLDRLSRLSCAQDRDERTVDEEPA